MLRRRGPPTAIAVLLVGLAAPAAIAQQTPGWKTETTTPGRPAPPPAVAPSLPAVLPPPATPPGQPNITVVPRSLPEPKAATLPPGIGVVSLVAVLTADGQSIEQGLVWRVYRDRAGADRKAGLLSIHREATPTLRLETGDYIINVTLGRAHLTRKVAVKGERPSQERFVLNAGGLRLTPVLAGGEPMTERAVVYDVVSDERDQYGQRVKVVSAARPGVIVRLNAGIYGILSTYGDANAVARADVTVEAGKLTEVTLRHAAAKVTFKLVTRPNGDAIADTQWSIATPSGETVKESVGAVPSHMLAPGTYTVSAKHAGRVFQGRFAVRAGETRQVEVMMH
jgi:hypothetical protein